MPTTAFLHFDVRLADRAADGKEDMSRICPGVVVIDGKRIVAVGKVGDCAVPPGATIFDGRQLAGAPGGLPVLCPGLVDAHVHLMDGGRSLEGPDLSACTSREEFCCLLREAAEHRPPDEWIVGCGWDEARLGGEPSKEWVDEALGGRCAYLSRWDLHTAVVSSAALAAAGIGSESGAPPGGIVERGPDGTPTGVLRETATRLVRQVWPRCSPPETQRRALAAAQRLLHSHGVTQVHSMTTLSHDNFHDVNFLNAAAQDGTLQLRVLAAVPLSEADELAAHIARHPQDPQGLVRLGIVKAFLDGSLGSRTAAMLEPYSNFQCDCCKLRVAPTEECAARGRGLFIDPEQEVLERILHADTLGLQCAVHAIGDASVRLAATALEQCCTRNGARDRRFRVEHCQHCAPADIERLGRLGAVASMQPLHMAGDAPSAAALLGAERCRTAYPFRSLGRAGARVVLGSDWMVVPPNTAGTLRAAVAPPPPFAADEALPSFDDALAAHTTAAAHAGFWEADTGVLRAGTFADLAVWAVADDGLPERVLLTVFNGSVVYADPAVP